MALWSAFCGGSYQALSPSIAADTCVNLFTETRQIAPKVKQQTLYGTPGLKRDAIVSQVGCRGWFTLDDRVWVVVGGELYERTGTSTYLPLGSIANDGTAVFFASNGQGGNQLAIVGGGELKVLDLTTNALSAAITLPFSNPVMIVFLDGYGLINERDTPKVWYSALEDLATWDALDFFVRSNTGDNVVGLAVTKDRIWTFGSQTASLYYDQGDVDNPFQPYPGTTMQVGAITASAIATYNDVVTWLAMSPQGQARIVRAIDAQAETISTPPIDLFLARCGRLLDAEVLVYEQEGHPFAVFTCPSSPDAIQSYAFDHRENLWHARAGWNETAGDWLRWRARGGTATGQLVLVGDYATGHLYTLDLETYDDDGNPLIAERTAPYLGDENQFVFVNEVELGIQPGVGTAACPDPQVELFVSRNGAQTFASAGTRALGKIGEYLTRAVWHRLGRARADRVVLRVRQSDPVKRVWGPGLWVSLSSGTGQA